MSDSSQQIIFTSSEPSLAVVYDAKSGLHSVYKIRKALAEECQMVCGPNETTFSLFNHSINASPMNVGNNLSANKSHVNKGCLSIFGKDISRVCVATYMRICCRAREAEMENYL